MKVLSLKEFFLKKIVWLICFIGILFSVASVSYYINSEHLSQDISLVIPQKITPTESHISLPHEVANVDEGNDLDIVQNVVNAGDVAGVLVKEWMDSSEVILFIDSCKDVFNLTKLRAGHPYTIQTDKNGFSQFEYEIDSEEKLIVRRENGEFTAFIEPIQYDIKLEKIYGKIDSSLFLTMTELGEAPSLAIKIADLFAWDINFIKDVQVGDFFTILVEKRFKDGEFKGYGKLLVAEFTNRGKMYDAYLYSTDHGDQYFTYTGENIKRQFLKAPLSFTRISSHFTNARLHPIFKTWKAHPAVDYAAPTGTPVKAVADGEVVYVGKGKGEGNFIKLTHRNSYETAYLHLSKFASSIKKGKKVSQGEVIGYVGSTGYATGPHLDFRMKKNGVYVNPEVALSPRSTPLKVSEKPLFAKRRDALRDYFNNENAVATYGNETPEEIVE